MHSYRSPPRCSSPHLLLITALLLSSYSSSYHSFHPLILATALLLSSSPQLSTLLFLSTALLLVSLLHISHLLSYLHLFILSSPTFHSSPRFLLASALLLSLTTSSPTCFITCLPRHLHVSSWLMSSSIESSSSRIGAMLIDSKLCFPSAFPPRPFPSSSSVNAPGPRPHLS